MRDARSFFKMSMRTIHVVPYEPNWVAEFEKIRRELADALGGDAIAIEHVGSTSVAGLWAKPIIDIDIVLDDGKLQRVIEALANIGYTHCGDLGIEGREAFDYSSEEKPHLMAHHLYACHKDSAELKRHMALRDFLRVNAVYRDKYSEIKKEMAQKHPHDIDAYIEGKAPVISEIYKLCGLE